MRLFIGIPLTAEVTDQLLSVMLRYRAKDDGLRWSAPESWHATLQFLGNTSQEQYNCIVARLHALHSRPVHVELDSLGFFDRAGVFFAGITLTSDLLLLQQQVVAATLICGFPPETRPYHPHITLARSTGKRGKRGLHQLMATVRRHKSFSSFISQEILLYESHLGSSGSHYEVREKFSLSEERAAPGI